MKLGRYCIRAWFEFKLQDLWIGAYWTSDVDKAAGIAQGDIWVCLVPCIPLHICWDRIDPEAP